jgi:carbamoyl-phosphate synthase large subunit
VMASAADAASAFARAERAAGRALPVSGRAFVSVRDADKVAVIGLARGLAANGFELVATAGTAAALELDGIAVTRVDKGAAVVELVAGGGVDLIVNTPQGRNARRDGYAIREAALQARVPCITTIAGARAALEAIRGADVVEQPRSLQERHAAPNREVLRAAS